MDRAQKNTSLKYSRESEANASDSLEYLKMHIALLLVVDWIMNNQTNCMDIVTTIACLSKGLMYGHL